MTLPRSTPLALAAMLACTGPATQAPKPTLPEPTATSTVTARPEVQDGGAREQDTRLAMVAQIHGGAGPWAVAGYRMGAYALEKFGLTRGSFDLEIIHFTPHEVQYSCIADGAAAATGASVGKLNLTLLPVAAAETRTLYRQRSTGATLTLRVTSAFAARFGNVPRAQLGSAGRLVMGLKDDEIFEFADAL